MYIYSKQVYRTKHFIKLPVGCFYQVVDGEHFDQFCKDVEQYDSDCVNNHPMPVYEPTLECAHINTVARLEGIRLDKYNEEIGVNKYELMTVVLTVESTDSVDLVNTTARLINRMVVNRTLYGNCEINEIDIHDEGFESVGNIQP